MKELVLCSLLLTAIGAWIGHLWWVELGQWSVLFPLVAYLFGFWFHLWLRSSSEERVARVPEQEEGVFLLAEQVPGWDLSMDLLVKHGVSHISAILLGLLCVLLREWIFPDF